MARREVVRREERVSPTPETLAKLVSDPLLALEPDHQRAVLEIREAYSIITAPVAVRRHRLTREPGGIRDHETIREVQLQDRYNNWVDEMARYKNRIIFILDAIVDHELPVLIIKRRLPEICDAMSLYCRLHPRALKGIDEVTVS